MYLHDYLTDFRLGLEKLDEYGFAESFEIKEELRANKQLILTAKVVLIDGSLFQVKEYMRPMGQAIPCPHRRLKKALNVYNLKKSSEQLSE